MDPSLYGSKGGNYFLLKNFCPSATPFRDFSNPGACNVKRHHIYVPISYHNPEKIICKKTPSVEEKIQKGGGSDLEIFKQPIKVSRTLLFQLADSEKQEGRKDSIEQKEGENNTKTDTKKEVFNKNKRLVLDKNPKLAKKKKYTFKVKA